MNPFIKFIVKTIVNYIKRFFANIKLKSLEQDLDIKKGEMEHELEKASDAVDDFERKLAEYKAGRSDTDKLQ